MHETQESGLPVEQLFAHGRALMTVLLWLAFAANMVSLHFLTSWLPTVITESGVPLSHAVIATAMLQAGGAAGSVAVGMLLDRVRDARDSWRILGGGALRRKSRSRRDQ